MAERVWNMEVVSVDATGNKLTVKSKKFQVGKTTEASLSFAVAATTPIKDRTGKPIKLSDIHPGSKVNVDYVKGSDGSLAAQSVRQA
jgi:hypothetical protein